MRFPKIAHIMTDLNGFGGTEATLLRYLQASGIPQDCHRVIVLKDIGVGETLGAQMVMAGFPVVALAQKGGTISIGGLYRLYRELHAFQPDIISGWLYHPSLLASFMKPWLKPRPAVVWHIRSLPFVGLRQKPGRYVVQRTLALLSRWTEPVLVSNSDAAMTAHTEIGFQGDSKYWTIIPNGIDAATYRPQREDGLAVRQQLGVPDDALLIGCVGRFVPEKGYPVMFGALALALRKLRPAIASRLHFLAVGNEVTAENPAFRGMATTCLPLSRLHLLGKRADVPRLLRALDIFVLPSLSESFPNSLVEAMATGLACTATDVGQCREVLAAPEWVVPAGDEARLADRIIALAEMTVQERERLGAINRERVATHFTLGEMVASLDAFFSRAVFSDG